jgi:uncharacterized Zn-finger protein
LEDDDDCEGEEMTEAQDLRTKFNEMPSVKNLSETPNKSDILKLIEDIEKNNQLIYENSKPTVLWKKRKPRSLKPKSQTETSAMRNEINFIDTPEPKLIMKPFAVDSSGEKSMMEYETHGNVVVYREKYSCICRYCTQSFHSEFLLKRHLKTHSIEEEEETVICCNQHFTMSDYKNHKRIIHAENTVACKSCGKVLKNQKTYRIHLKSHLVATDRKFKCDEKNCNKAFNMKIHLDNHQRIHSNLSPFECPLPQCHTAFKQKHQVKIHLRNKHNINSSIVHSLDNSLE